MQLNKSNVSGLQCYWRMWYSKSHSKDEEPNVFNHESTDKSI